MQTNKGIKATDQREAAARPSGGVFLVCMIVVLAALFYPSLDPAQVQFANDGPYGAIAADYGASPSSFKGIWQDLNGLGTTYAIATPNLTGFLLLALRPLGFAKFYVPLALLFLGFCAWILFRQWKLSPLACILGGLAVMLNSAFFSAACWGVAPQAICFGCNFLALAALVGDTPGRYWVRTALAGFAVGVGVMEGADIGALFSLVIAGFTFVHTWITTDGAILKKLVRGVARVALVAVCAGFVAYQVVSALIGTQILGVVGTGQDAETKARRWSEATQWSLPKAEVLALGVPGLFGYRMDTPMGLADTFLGFPLQKELVGGQYWGGIGRHAAWDDYFASDRKGPAPDANSQFIRFGGGGSYEGVLVILLAAWAAAQLLRGKNSIFTLHQRRLLWFWVAVAGVGLLMAFGRHAPFYQLFYSLPYTSTIRNPVKFTTWFNWGILIAFAYGVDGLSRRYLETRPATGSGGWWQRAAAFDKRWIIGSLIAVAASLIAWRVYAGSRLSLEKYLQTVLFDPEAARSIAAFSIEQVGWFIFFLMAGVIGLIMVLSGNWAGKSAKWAGLLLGLVLVVDLGRANLPWIIYWNYKVKYEVEYDDKSRGPNPVIQFLSDKPYNHRAIILPTGLISKVFQLPAGVVDLEERLDTLYGIEWKQQLFQYYNIQSLDLVQMPRMGQDLFTYINTLYPRGPQTLSYLTREWELTNTRYVLGCVAFLDLLNKQFDPGHERFRVLQRFGLAAKPGISRPSRWQDMTAVASPEGPYALFEFTGALPRVGLYAHWQVPARDPALLKEFLAAPFSTNELEYVKSLGTNNYLTLQTLVSPAFDPHQTVLLAESPVVPAPAGTTNQNAGTVEFLSYSSKDIVLKTEAATPTILLLNDKYDPTWKVRVDGQPAELLRCNFIMRGVYLPAGPHTVTFTFRWPLGSTFITGSALLISFVLLGFLIFSKPRTQGRAP